jgi:hypothetical protein
MLGLSPDNRRTSIHIYGWSRKLQSIFREKRGNPTLNCEYGIHHREVTWIVLWAHINHPDHVGKRFLCGTCAKEFMIRGKGSNKVVVIKQQISGNIPICEECQINYVSKGPWCHDCWTKINDEMLR